MTTTQYSQPPATFKTPPAQRRKVFDRPDGIVLLCGIAAALFLFAYPYVIDEQRTPWDRQWMLAFPLLWSWLLPLAGSLLADMRSMRRWTFAILVYAIILPGLAALSLLPVGGIAPLNPPRSLLSANFLGTAFIPAVLGFMLLPIIRAFDSTRALCNYSGVFRAAWRLTVHGVLAGALAISVIMLLFLGAQLFETIGLSFFVKMFEKSAFWHLVLPLTFAISLIGIQRHAQLATVLQRSWLTLNGWILPLASVLGVAFVAALVSQLAFGLRAGTLSASVLIGFSAVWIKLVNATWQDSPETAALGSRLRRPLRWSLYGLLPLTGLALYNVLVRVDQYGWTDSRIWAALAAMIAVIYSVGYALAAMRPARFHAVLAGTNYIAAFVAIVLLMAFSTPALDPRRVTADSQIQRLMDGRLILGDFDFQLMASRSGPYGRVALQRLADGAADDRDPQIASIAKQTLAGQYTARSTTQTEPRDMPAFTVYPAGRGVPPGWWTRVGRRDTHVGECTLETTYAAGSRAKTDCAVIYADLSGTGIEDLILYVPVRHTHNQSESFVVYSRTASGDWRRNGTLERVDALDNALAATSDGSLPPSTSSTLLSDIKRGAVRTAPRRDRDLVIGDIRLSK